MLRLLLAASAVTTVFGQNSGSTDCPCLTKTQLQAKAGSLFTKKYNTNRRQLDAANAIKRALAATKSCPCTATAAEDSNTNGDTAGGDSSNNNAGATTPPPANNAGTTTPPANNAQSGQGKPVFVFVIANYVA